MVPTIGSASYKIGLRRLSCGEARGVNHAAETTAALICRGLPPVSKDCQFDSERSEHVNMSHPLAIVSPARIVRVIGGVMESKEIDQLLEKVSEEQTNQASDSPTTSQENAFSKTQMKAELERALRTLRVTDERPGILSASENKVSSLLQTFIGRIGLTEGRVVERSGIHDQTAEVMFDEGDWMKWAESFFEFWKIRKPHPWKDTPSNIILNDVSRVAVLGDWGSGIYGAPVCTQSIERDRAGYDVLLHLGDVYYSGDVEEIDERFHAFWPDPAKTDWASKQSVIHRACNSNHEMYSGGHGYFDTVSKFDQSASYFSLSNDHWILAGLDTGYEEGSLVDGQVHWLKKLIAEADGRRIVLFSHHQPFSWFGNGYEGVRTKLAEVLHDRSIFAWYWGHEHTCAFYDRHPVYGFWGRCAGHGGFPYFRQNFEGIPSEKTRTAGGQTLQWKLAPKTARCPAGRILDGPNCYIPGYEEDFGPHGYLTLELNGDRLNEIVHDADGGVLYENELRANG